MAGKKNLLSFERQFTVQVKEIENVEFQLVLLDPRSSLRDICHEPLPPTSWKDFVRAQAKYQDYKNTHYCAAYPEECVGFRDALNVSVQMR